MYEHRMIVSRCGSMRKSARPNSNIGVCYKHHIRIYRVHTYIYIYIHTYIHLYIHTYIHTYMHTHTMHINTIHHI